MTVAVNRRGITRTVLLTRRWAVKVPSLRANGHGFAGVLWSFCRGVLANQSEQEWSGTPGLNPVVWTWGGLVSVYRRARVLDDVEPWPRPATPEWCPVGDPKPDNVGYVDGELVWLDYDFSYNGRRT